MEYPVLIGSQALSNYGWSLEGNHDWDIIMTTEQNTSLAKKYDKWAYFRWRKSFDVKECHVDACEVQGAKKFIYDYCNKNLSDIKQLDHPELGKLLIPPLEFLYALKKAHIHRILEHHNSTLENIKTWKIQVLQYNWMREKLGYQKIDAIIYHEDGGLRTNFKSSESDMEYLTQSIFVMEFNAVTYRVGDTKISMNKTEEEFFADGVNRFIDHDELHRKVAQMCRQTDEVLFKQFIIGDAVEMNRELFLAADRTIQIQTIREEIIVLLLERKLIPTMVRNRDLGICYDGLDMGRREDEMREIIAHFMTNLCGQGHHWLRRWCIDHYKMFDTHENFQNLYPHADIDQIAVAVSRIQDLTDKLVQSGSVSISDFVLRGPLLRTVEDRYGTEEVTSTRLNSISDWKINKFTYSQKLNIGRGDQTVTLKCIILGDDKNITDCTLIYHFEATPVMTLVLRRMTSKETKYVYKTGFVIYDSFSNIGIIHENKKVTSLFRVSNITNGTEYAVQIEQITLEDFNVSISIKAWERHSFNYWYESVAVGSDGEDLCPGQTNQINTSRSYLSTYGTMPNILNPLFETLVRHHLGVIKDEKKLKRGTRIDGQYVDGDSDAFTSSGSSDDSD